MAAGKGCSGANLYSIDKHLTFASADILATVARVEAIEPL